jgi:hypothetical protein
LTDEFDGFDGFDGVDDVVDAPILEVSRDSGSVLLEVDQAPFRTSALLTNFDLHW